MVHVGDPWRRRRSLKYVVVILDGAAGWPLAQLGGLTTLEASATPNLDEMVRGGLLGLAKTVPEGSEPSSSAACTSILGYDPIADYVGRGAIEAASMGINLGPDDVALRCNLVTIADGRMESYASGHISTEESRAIVADLAEMISQDPEFSLYPGVAYRHIFVAHGHPELLDLEYTAPHDIPGGDVASHLPKGQGAEILLDCMERARPLLAKSEVNQARIAAGKLPATDVWPFWPGIAPKEMSPFHRKRGVSAALTSGVDLLNGLAVLSEVDRLDIPGVTDNEDNDYIAQANGALAALDDHDLVVIHVESPDEAGHAGDIAGKMVGIEAIDREVVAPALAYAEEHPGEVRILAMPDHPTPIVKKTHVGEPVPFVIWGSGIATNGGTAFSEAEAARTGFLLDPGRGVMDVFLG